MATLPTIPNLHDGWFDGLWLSDEKDNTGVCLFVRAVGGERFTLVLTGVARLNIQDVRQGNIILGVLLVSPDSVTIGQIEEAYGLQGQRDEEMSHRMLEKAHKDGMCALEMSTSYGACGTVLFQTAKLVPGHILESSP